MHSLPFTSLPLFPFLFLLPALSTALPEFLHDRAAAPNITQLTCFPAEPGNSLPPLPMRNCRFALHNFTSAHVSPGPGPHTITFTTNRTSAASNPTQFVLTPIEVAPSNEPVTGGPTCSLAFAVYYGSAPLDQRPDVTVTLGALRMATREVIQGCTGGKEVGNGGSVVLTPDGGLPLDITVQRPV